MIPEQPKHKYLKVLLIILGIVILCSAVFLGYLYYKNKTSKAETATTTSKTTPTKTGTEADRKPACSGPDELTAEETALFEGAPTIDNAAYHFSYKVLPEWQAALYNTDNLASFANFPWGDESLAAINLMIIVGEEKVAEFPIGELAEVSHRTVNIDCIDATYTVYQPTNNEHWDKDEYHIRTTFTKDGVPYLIVLNYPFQGASADGDVVDAYNTTLKTIDFE